jgi:RIO kinase 1
MSGKEAMVFVVRCGDETRCAKVYKEATQRSFRQAVDYTENRKVKNSRQARAMAKGTRSAGSAGGRLAERRGRCAVPAGGGRRARAPAVQLPRRRAADGAGGRCRRRRRAAAERRAFTPRRRARTMPRC